MSNLNLNWLTENLKPNAIIFDIGCADLHDTIKIKSAFPSGTFYAFECAKFWHEQNELRAKTHGINYYPVAMADNDGHVDFFPSEELKEENWPWSGSICEPGTPLINDSWKWGNHYRVSCIRLDSFCEKHSVIPDFIHIDAQGAEFKIFKHMGDMRPKMIWSEISEFHMYKTDTTVENYKELMFNLGYSIAYIDNQDALFVLNDYTFTKYIHAKN
jgi:hypothetical protein